LNKTQFWESPLTVMDDWVRAVKRWLPWRQASQLGQLQFHWGNPPPAAEPKTCTFTLKIPGVSPAELFRLTGAIQRVVQVVGLKKWITK